MEFILNQNYICVMHSSDGIVWNESVIKVESGTSDLVNIPHANDFSVLDVFDAFVEGDAGDECVAMFIKVGCPQHRLWRSRYCFQ